MPVRIADWNTESGTKSLNVDHRHCDREHDGNERVRRVIDTEVEASEDLYEEQYSAPDEPPISPLPFGKERVADDPERCRQGRKRCRGMGVTLPWSQDFDEGPGPSIAVAIAVETKSTTKNTPPPGHEVPPSLVEDERKNGRPSDDADGQVRW